MCSVCPSAPPGLSQLSATPSRRASDVLFFFIFFFFSPSLPSHTAFLHQRESSLPKRCLRVSPGTRGTHVFLEASVLTCSSGWQKVGGQASARSSLSGGEKGPREGLSREQGGPTGNESGDD